MVVDVALLLVKYPSIDSIEDIYICLVDEFEFNFIKEINTQFKQGISVHQ